MKYLLTLIAIGTATLSFSQSEKYSAAYGVFQNNYNTNAYSLIYDGFSPAMQNALPLEKTIQFFSGLQLQAGKITAAEFLKMENEQTAVYITTFERGVFAIQISIDNNNKISGFLVKPYSEPSKSTIVNQLNNYPKELATIIIENAKDFPSNTQISIAVIQNGTTSYYGVKIVNDKLVADENQNKVFEIGSLSKVFTATVLADLSLDGKMKLTDKINSFYPFIFKNRTQLTFESLANHTAGLPKLPTNLDISSTENPYKNYGVKELDAYLANQMLLAQAENNTYEYSNLGLGLLGHTLGIAENTTFSQLLETKIFRKYKMNHSFTTSKRIENLLVKGLDESGKTVSNWDFDVLAGAGGILSTTTDLVQLAKAQFDPKNKALQLTRNPTATVNDGMKIGLGWHILKSKKANDFVWHNGGTGGYSSSMAVDVKNKNAVIILSNVSGLSPKNKDIDEMCFQLMDMIER